MQIYTLYAYVHDDDAIKKTENQSNGKKQQTTYTHAYQGVDSFPELFSFETHQNRVQYYEAIIRSCVGHGLLDVEGTKIVLGVIIN